MTQFCMFQSSLAPRGRCYAGNHRLLPRQAGFQSSLAPRGRCYRGGLNGKRRHPGFNPHWPLGAGATLPSSQRVKASDLFQSSLAPRGRCYKRPPARRVRRSVCFNPHWPLGAGATAGAAPDRTRPKGFNPHWPLGAGATASAAICWASSSRFQSSLAPRGRCYRRAAGGRRMITKKVSILTGP